MHEESIYYILLYCVKTRTLRALFFTLIRVQWVLSASVKVTLLGSDGSFVGEKKKKKNKGSLGSKPLMYFFGKLCVVHR